MFVADQNDSSSDFSGPKKSNEWKRNVPHRKNAPIEQQANDSGSDEATLFRAFGRKNHDSLFLDNI